MCRVTAKGVISQINRIDPSTTYSVVEGRLFAGTSQGALHPEQRVLLKAYKEDILELLSTPPEENTQSRCARCGNFEYVLAPFGVWLCPCYFDPPPLKPLALAPAQRSQDTLKAYWR